MVERAAEKASGYKATTTMTKLSSSVTSKSVTETNQASMKRLLSAKYPTT
jgi:hypothetical protein